MHNSVLIQLRNYECNSINRLFKKDIEEKNLSSLFKASYVLLYSLSYLKEAEGHNG